MSVSSSEIPNADQRFGRVAWDVGQLAGNFRFWVFLAWLEVRQQYRRSSLGPFWITLTTALYVATLILVFGQLFGIRDQSYAPWVTLGVISWNLITTSLNDAGLVLISKKQLLTQRQVSHNGLVLASVLKALFGFAHQLPIYVAVMYFFAIEVTWHTAWILVTIPALIVILHPMCLIVSYVSTRLRDIPPLVNAVLTPMFFLTPIMWIPEQLGERAWIADWNPFSAMIALIREPLLGRGLELNSLYMVVMTAALSWGVALLIQFKFRRRIMYWA